MFRDQRQAIMDSSSLSIWELLISLQMWLYSVLFSLSCSLVEILVRLVMKGSGLSSTSSYSLKYYYNTSESQTLLPLKGYSCLRGLESSSKFSKVQFPRGCGILTGWSDFLPKFSISSRYFFLPSSQSTYLESSISVTVISKLVAIRASRGLQNPSTKYGFRGYQTPFWTLYTLPQSGNTFQRIAFLALIQYLKVTLHVESFIHPMLVGKKYLKQLQSLVGDMKSTPYTMMDSSQQTNFGKQSKLGLGARNPSRSIEQWSLKNPLVCSLNIFSLWSRLSALILLIT